jgi:GNAT superfamily N-acetyltransferase
MRIEQVGPADAARIQGCYEVYTAALPVDAPGDTGQTERRFGDWLADGATGDPREAWAFSDQDEGPVAGWYRLELPDKENLDRAYLDLTVLPAARRHGIGRALLRHAAERAATHGRSLLGGFAQEGSPGQALARAVGATASLVDIRRVLELAQLPAGKLPRLREEAERAAVGYSLVSWAGPVPEEIIDQVAELYNALGDAPHDADSAPEAWDAQRIRERLNANRGRHGTVLYTVAAQHDASGELAALTEVMVDPADPGWGHQMVTAVIRKHRGHRLGLLVKIAMVDLLATEEPRVARIATWNTESNQHMIAINEALGYTILGQPYVNYRVSAASLLG